MVGPITIDLMEV